MRAVQQVCAIARYRDLGYTQRGIRAAAICLGSVWTCLCRRRFDALRIRGRVSDARFVNFHLISIPKYWEEPELRPEFRDER